MTPAQTAFLLMLTRTGNINISLRLAGCAHADLQQWQRADEGFASKIDEALGEAESWLVYQAWRRAIEGVKVPYFFEGRQAGVKTIYSDKLLLWFLAKTGKSDPGGQPEDNSDSTNLRTELAAKLAQLAEEFDTETD